MSGSKRLISKVMKNGKTVMRKMVMKSLRMSMRKKMMLKKLTTVKRSSPK